MYIHTYIFACTERISNKQKGVVYVPVVFLGKRHSLPVFPFPSGRVDSTACAGVTCAHAGSLVADVPIHTYLGRYLVNVKTYISAVTCFFAAPTVFSSHLPS